MRKIALLLAVLFVLSVFAGCSQKELTLVDERKIDTSRSPSDQALIDEVLSRVNNVLPAEWLITKEYTQPVLDYCWREYNPLSAKGVVYYHPGNLELFLGVEVLRKRGDNEYYAMYKLHEGGWVYLFMEDFSPDYEESYPIVTHALYREGKANKQALRKIQVGSSFADVCAADPDAEMIRKYDLNRLAWDIASDTLHWCDNEVFIFDYDESGETVTSVKHYPDGRVPCGKNWYFDYNLLPVDCR